jgi:hypothetical protein
MANEFGIEVGDVVEAAQAFRSRNDVNIRKGDRFKVHKLEGFGRPEYMTVIPLDPSHYNDTMIVVWGDSLGKVRDA